MKRWLFLTLLPFQSVFAVDLDFSRSSEHFELMCTEKDLPVCDELLEESEKMYGQLSEEFNYRLDHTLSVYMFPDILSFHRAIHREDAPDWIIVSGYDLSIQMVSPLNPGTYHSTESVKKGLLRTITGVFIREKFQGSNPPWWLIEGVTAKKTGWPYVTWCSSPPGILELETMTCSGFGMGYYALSLVSYIQEKYGWEAILGLLEDYSSFEQALGLPKEELVRQWHLYTSQFNN